MSCSVCEDDVSFGSLGPFWKADLSGRNCLFVCSGQDQRDFPRISEKINLLVNSKQPTRILLIIPTQLLSQLVLPPRKILEIASVPIALPLIRPEEVDCKYFGAKESYSIILALNQESMLIDPIQWDDFKKALLVWAEENCLDLVIPDLTDNLFTERVPLPHPARAMCKSPSFPSAVYRFFDFASLPKLETNHLVLHGIPIDDAKLIAKINQHNPSLSMIGILPNQLRQMLKRINQNDNGFEELSKDLFWKGYGIWKIRKRLMSNFWKKIAPEEWKIHKGKNKPKKDNKEKKSKKVKKAYPCQNPFHFLKRHCDLSQTLLTPCPCPRTLKRKTVHRYLDIRAFIFSESHNSSSSISSERHTTREDLVRGAHDRGKKARHY